MTIAAMISIIINRNLEGTKTDSDPIGRRNLFIN